jgi:hypothetical protein
MATPSRNGVKEEKLDQRRATTQRGERVRLDGVDDRALAAAILVVGPPAGIVAADEASPEKITDGTTDVRFARRTDPFIDRRRQDCLGKDRVVRQFGRELGGHALP